MAKPTSLSLPEAASNAADQAHLPTQLPANPEAPPVPPTEVSFPDGALDVLGVHGQLPEWLLG
jgi:hypothetical protein